MDFICPICHHTKPANAFSRRMASKTGVQVQCKACQAAYVQAHQAQRLVYAQTHRQKNRARYTLTTTHTLTCACCHQAKPETAFHVATTRRTGRQAACKACQAAYRKAHPQHVARHQATHRQKNCAHYTPTATRILICPECHRAKPETAFSVDRSRRTGRQGRCKTCYAQWRRARRNTVTTHAS
jgi:hypothetical protein